MRLLAGIILIALGSGGVAGEVLKLKIPAASWFFDTSRRLPLVPESDVPVIGWVMAVGAILAGLWLLSCSIIKRQKHPSEIMRQERFKEVKRGVWSLRIILLLVFLAALDFLIVGNKPLVMKYEGKLYYPAFDREVYKGEDFGIQGELALAPVNFRSLKKSFKDKGENWIVMPLHPYAPTGDTLPAQTRDLKVVDGVYQTSSGTSYSGLAARVRPEAEGQEELSLHIRYRLRDGVLSGPVDGWNNAGERVYSATYTVSKEGVSEMASESYFGLGSLESYLRETENKLKIVDYHPAPPSRKHILGTDSGGNDVLAYLYGGLQVNIQAALFYIPFVYLIGATIGLLMGYFGGIFDLVFQRVIEALEAIPFLFVIIIVSSVIPIEYKGLGMILLILISFGWMGKTYLMRTAAYREKSRDYVASARVLGASTSRIVGKHILPNILSILVTIVPFAISGVVTAITSLDYLGFGLPPEYASWGKLLDDGLKNLSSPWLVSSAFVMLVSLLTLITFLGEAIREAYDPRKFTTYR